MIPGFGGDALGKAGEEESARRLTRCITMMKSMADSGKYSVAQGPALALFAFPIVNCQPWSLAPPLLELDHANAGKLFRAQPSRTARVAKGTPQNSTQIATQNVSQYHRQAFTSFEDSNSNLFARCFICLRPCRWCSSTLWMPLFTGAGVGQHDVGELLSQYVKFAAMVKKMGGIKNLFRGNGEKVSAQQMQKLNMSMAKMMDPRVLQQMGEKQHCR